MPLALAVSNLLPDFSGDAALKLAPIVASIKADVANARDVNRIQALRERIAVFERAFNDLQDEAGRKAQELS